MQNRTLSKLFVICALIMTLVTSAVKPSYALFDKTRFAADLGIAFFCFHHWVLKPYREGAFAAGAPHRTKALIKAGAALLVAMNRVKKADEIAHDSKSPLLQKVAGSLDQMTASFGSLGQRLKGGQFNPKDVDDLNSTVDQVGSGASTAIGRPIKDVAIPDPGN